MLCFFELRPSSSMLEPLMLDSAPLRVLIAYLHMIVAVERCLEGGFVA